MTSELSVTGRRLSKGWIGRVLDGEMVAVFTFQFNPSEITHDRGVEWVFESPTGSSLPTAIFRAIGGDTFALTLLLDATELNSRNSDGVRAKKAFLESLTQPDISKFNDDLGQFVAPPAVKFGMGGLMFDVVVSRASFRDVRFQTDLVESRTYVDLELRTYFVSVAAIKAHLQRLSSLRSRVETQLSLSEVQGL